MTTDKAAQAEYATLEDVKQQLQDKCLELEKEIALRKLLNSQKEEQAKKLRAAEQQLQLLAATKPGGTETAERGQLLSLLRDAEERNEELVAKLHESEVELQKLKLSQLRSETASSAKMATQSAALMERLSSMQREREKILTSQLRAALNERQEALRRASGAPQLDKDVAEKAQNTEFQQVFEQMKVAKDGYQLQQQGAILVAKVKALRQDYDSSIRDKLQFLKSERDAAETKAKSLSFDVAQLQRRLEMAETEYKLIDKTRIKALQAQLLAITEERDEWEDRVYKLEDTIDTLKILHTLQRELKPEEDIKRAYEAKLKKCEAEKKDLQLKIEIMVAERNRAIIECNRIASERDSLAVDVQNEHARAEKYERLATVLRKRARSASKGSETPPVKK